MRSRQWRYTAVLLLAGAVFTVALCADVARKPGVFYAEVQVLFLAPASRVNPNNLLAASDGEISTAGAVAKMVEPHASDAHVVSPTVTLVDQGVRYGSSVTLPNDGGQFNNLFDQPLLNVQAVAGSAQDVRAMITSLEAKINRDLRRLQVRASVPPAIRIHTTVSPMVLPIVYEHGSRGRAVGSAFLLGLGLTLGARTLLRRRIGWEQPSSAVVAADTRP